MPWKEGGCYLITGGAGGLGRLFVQEIARRVKEALVILVGRSALTASQRAQLEETCLRGSSGGVRIDYEPVDVSNGPAVYALIQRVLAKLGHLDGIIHSAGVLRDSLVLNKTSQEVQEALAPKVIGVEHLDEASGQIPLDFFILCSSVTAVIGNTGQADYAAANAYLDAFAHARAAMVAEGTRQGTTVSINWPYWEEGGMQVEESTIKMMQEQLGIEGMGAATGMRMLYQALACGQAQVMVVHGQVERIKQRLLQRPAPPVGATPVGSITDLSRESGLEPRTVPTDKLREALKRIASRLLKVRVEEINAETELSEYGFDSITFTAFANRLNQTYQLDLTPPLFYEYSTVERLALYLQTTYGAVLAPHFAETLPLVAAPKDSGLVVSRKPEELCVQVRQGGGLGETDEVSSEATTARQ